MGVWAEVVTVVATFFGAAWLMTRQTNKRVDDTKDRCREGGRPSPGSKSGSSTWRIESSPECIWPASYASDDEGT